MLRAELARVFADELEKRDEPARTRLLDALDTVLSWPSWDNLRTLNGRSKEEAQATVEQMVSAMLLPAHFES
jgi:hypothetical protein